jgi:branched-chain amino acid aminotransferase
VLAYVNGDLLPEEDATVSVFNAGFNFADGVFEGIRVYGGRVFRLEDHIERLYASAATFEIEIGLSQSEMCDEILRWLSANGVEDDFHFRPIITRADRFPPRMDPRFSEGETTIVFIGGPVSPAGKGMKVVMSPIQRPAPAALPAHVKSLSYGPALLARLDAIRRGADEAIMLDELGLVANVFAYTGGALLTPQPRACLDGITRRAVMALARDAGIPAIEVGLTPEVLAGAEEIFLTGTSAEITPVIELDGRPVSGGEAGPVTLKLRDAFGKLTESEGTPIPVAADAA